MWEVIKNLTTGQKFYAFLVATFLTTASSILTVYMATDDCKGLSDQYENLVNNHTRLMKINNELINDNNQKQEDILKIAKLLEDASKCTTNVVYEMKKEKVNRPVINEIQSDSSVAASAIQVDEPQEIVVKKKKVIKSDINKQREQAIDSVLEIANKYKQ